jgi:hypothetical protein
MSGRSRRIPSHTSVTNTNIQSSYDEAKELSETRELAFSLSLARERESLCMLTETREPLSIGSNEGFRVQLAQTKPNVKTKSHITASLPRGKLGHL